MYKLTLFLVFACYLSSCQQPQNSLTDKGRNDIIDSIKLLNTQIFKAAEQANADLLISYFSNSPNFRFVNQEGQVFNYDSTLSLWRNGYRNIISQKIKTNEPLITVVNSDYAFETLSGEFTATFKDNSTYQKPVAWTQVLTHEGGKWKIIACQQSYHP